MVMKKIFRLIVAIVILVIGIAVLIAGVLIYLVDPNKIKPILAQQISKQTGYDITIYDKLKWTFYPFLGVNAKRITLSNPGDRSKVIDLRNITFTTETKELLENYKKLNGAITIDEIYFGNIHFSHARATLQLANNMITVRPLTAVFYQGTLDAEIKGQKLRAIPEWQVNARIRQVQLKPLLIDLTNASSKIKLDGVANVNIDATTHGNQKRDVLSNLNGSGNFNVINGELEGVDLNYFVQAADDLINKRQINLSNSLNKTSFESLTGSYTINHGIVTTNDVLLETNLFITKSSGRIDLINRIQNWQLNIAPLQSDKLKWLIPVIIQGDLKSPSVNLDMQAINAIITKEQIEKVKMQVQEKMGDLPMKANKILQHLIKRDA